MKDFLLYFAFFLSGVVLGAVTSADSLKEEISKARNENENLRRAVVTCQQNLEIQRLLIQKLETIN